MINDLDPEELEEKTAEIARELDDRIYTADRVSSTAKDVDNEVSSMAKDVDDEVSPINEDHPWL